MKIPRSNIGGTKLTTDTGVARRDPGQMSQVSRAVSGLGQVAQTAALKWEQAIDVIQGNTGKLNQKTKTTDLLQRASMDSDYNAAGKYLEENKKIREESIAGISNPANASRIGLELDYESEVTRIKLQNIFKKKTMAHGVADIKRGEITYKDAYINGDPTAANKYIDILKDARAAQYITEEAYVDKIGDVAKWDKSLILNALNNNPSLGAEGARQLLKGVDVTPEEHKSIIATAQALKNGHDKEMGEHKKKAKSGMENNLTIKAMKRELTLDELETAMDTDNEIHISDETGRTLFNMMTNPKKVVTPEETAKYNGVYADTVDNIMQAVNSPKGDLQTIKNKMMQELTISDFQELYNKKLIPAQDEDGNKFTASLADLIAIPNTVQANGGWSAAWNAMKKYATQASSLESGVPVYGLYRDFMRKVDMEMNSQAMMDATKQMIKDDVRKNNPGIALEEDIPNSIITGESGTVEILPDDSNIPATYKIVPITQGKKNG